MQSTELYAGNGYILSFLGVAPIDNPQIVLYLAMDNPKKCVQYGGTTAAPIARKIFMDVLPALHVKKVTQQREKAYVGLMLRLMMLKIM